jgi:soluble lytic murein transglycosylase
MVCPLVHDVGRNRALRFAKAASSYGTEIDDWGYPLRSFPDWRRLGNSVELPMILGVSRQESEFNSGATSPAGAQGLMQLMPTTAKLVAQQLNVAFDDTRLTSDPAYNVMLGAAHLGDLVANYRGSYVLALAAYNAGPGRVKEWIGRYGDPRRADVDPIDWIESVPFAETREFIQKVLQNVHVYRSLIAPGSALAMVADLKRGAAPTAAVRTDTKESQAGTSCESGRVVMAALTEVC